MSSPGEASALTTALAMSMAIRNAASAAGSTLSRRACVSMLISRFLSSQAASTASSLGRLSTMVMRTTWISLSRSSIWFFSCRRSSRPGGLAKAALPTSASR